MSTPIGSRRPAPRHTSVAPVTAAVCWLAAAGVVALVVVAAWGFVVARFAPMTGVGS